MRGNSNRRPSPPSGDTSWLDPETERRVQEINSAKEAAVRAEDFEAAKRLRRAEETLLRPGDSCDQGLPIRKNKGKVDKTREDGVEVYSACAYTYIPIPAWKR